jgi:nitrate/nitrite transporter NarK
MPYRILFPLNEKILIITNLLQFIVCVEWFGIDNLISLYICLNEFVYRDKKQWELYFFYRYAGGFGVFIKLIKGVTKSFNTDYELQQVCNN